MCSISFIPLSGQPLASCCFWRPTTICSRSSSALPEATGNILACVLCFCRRATGRACRTRSQTQGSIIDLVGSVVCHGRRCLPPDQMDTRDVAVARFDPTRHPERQFNDSISGDGQLRLQPASTCAPRRSLEAPENLRHVYYNF